MEISANVNPSLEFQGNKTPSFTSNNSTDCYTYLRTPAFRMTLNSIKLLFRQILFHFYQCLLLSCKIHHEQEVCVSRIATAMQCLSSFINAIEFIGMPLNVGRFKWSNKQEMLLTSENDVFLIYKKWRKSTNELGKSEFKENIR